MSIIQWHNSVTWLQLHCLVKEVLYLYDAIIKYFQAACSTTRLVLPELMWLLFKESIGTKNL